MILSAPMTKGKKANEVRCESPRLGNKGTLDFDNSIFSYIRVLRFQRKDEFRRTS